MTEETCVDIKDMTVGELFKVIQENPDDIWFTMFLGGCSFKVQFLSSGCRLENGISILAHNRGLPKVVEASGISPDVIEGVIRDIAEFVRRDPEDIEDEKHSLGYWTIGSAGRCDGTMRANGISLRQLELESKELDSECKRIGASWKIFANDSLVVVKCGNVATESIKHNGSPKKCLSQLFYQAVNSIQKTLGVKK